MCGVPMRDDLGCDGCDRDWYNDEKQRQAIGGVD